MNESAALTRIYERVRDWDDIPPERRDAGDAIDALVDVQQILSEAGFAFATDYPPAVPEAED